MRAQESHGCPIALVEVAQFFDGCGRDQRRVAGKHNYGFIICEGFRCAHQGVSCAALRLLPDESDARVSHGALHQVGFVSDDRVNVFGGGYLYDGSDGGIWRYNPFADTWANLNAGGFSASTIQVVSARSGTWSRT